ncbi:MAG TPA: patatin-like phospholipase family protein [Dactylosporangium sp.]|nr:patatin-like phospholipase family protein [Dactylosporangium sp.]
MDYGDNRADLVLEGGGVKGIALVGALSELEQAGYRFERVAGTSAGAVAGALVAAGMSTTQLQRVMYGLDYRRFCDKGTLDRIPLVGQGLSLLFERGVFNGDELREWLGNLLADRGVETFADLAIDDPGTSLAEDQQFRLVVMATDVTLGRLVRLPWDYREVYGLDPRQQRVVDAVRASMSIPFFFEPVSITNPETGRRSTLVDGGVLSNFPIDTFDRTDLKPPRWPTFGVKLLPALPADTRLLPLAGLRFSIPLLPPVQLLESVITTAMVGHDQTYLDQPWVAARTIRVDTKPVGVVEFDLSAERAQLLYDNGREAAKQFLADWKWEDYLAQYRPEPAAVGSS